MNKNIYDKIEELYTKKSPLDEPKWAKEIKAELKEIKRVLKDLQNPRRNRRKNQSYFTFVERFRQHLRADVDKGVYPEVHYQGKRIGVDIKGYLYDKATNKNLPAHEAFAVYEYFYAQKEKIDEFIIID